MLSPDGKIMVQRHSGRARKCGRSARGKPPRHRMAALKHRSRYRRINRSGQHRFAAVAADAKTAATWAYDGKITIWNLQTGKTANTIKAGYPVRPGIALSPDGKRVVAFKDGLKQWDTDSGKEMGTFTIPNERIDYMDKVRFPPDGKTLIGVSNRALLLWNVEGVEYRQSIPLQDTVASRNAFAASPDGKTLAIAERDKRLQLLDVTTGKELGKLPGPARPATSPGLTTANPPPPAMAVFASGTWRASCNQKVNDNEVTEDPRCDGDRGPEQGDGHPGHLRDQRGHAEGLLRPRGEEAADGVQERVRFADPGRPQAREEVNRARSELTPRYILSLMRNWAETHQRRTVRSPT